MTEQRQCPAGLASWHLIWQPPLLSLSHISSHLPSEPAARHASRMRGYVDMRNSDAHLPQRGLSSVWSLAYSRASDRQDAERTEPQQAKAVVPNPKTHAGDLHHVNRTVPATHEVALCVHIAGIGRIHTATAGGLGHPLSRLPSASPWLRRRELRAWRSDASFDRGGCAAVKPIMTSE